MRSLLILGLLIPNLVYAETFIVGTLGSYHLNREKSHNEKNWGLGIEQDLVPSVRVVAGFYRNSNRRDSFYFGSAWAPVSFGPIKLGISPILVTGYETVTVRTERGPDGKERKTLDVSDQPKFAPLPFVSYEGKKYGANLIFAPKTDQNGSVLALQVKYKFQ